MSMKNLAARIAATLAPPPSPVDDALLSDIASLGACELEELWDEALPGIMGNTFFGAVPPPPPLPRQETSLSKLNNKKDWDVVTDPVNEETLKVILDAIKKRASEIGLDLE